MRPPEPAPRASRAGSHLALRRAQAEAAAAEKEVMAVSEQRLKRCLALSPAKRLRALDDTDLVPADRVTLRRSIEASLAPKRRRISFPPVLAARRVHSSRTIYSDQGGSLTSNNRPDRRWRSLAGLIVAEHQASGDHDPEGSYKVQAVGWPGADPSTLAGLDRDGIRPHGTGSGDRAVVPAPRLRHRNGAQSSASVRPLIHHDRVGPTGRTPSTSLVNRASSYFVLRSLSGSVV